MSSPHINRKINWKQAIKQRKNTYLMRIEINEAFPAKTIIFTNENPLVKT